jgi:hypothetical protein
LMRFVVPEINPRSLRTDGPSMKEDIAAAAVPLRVLFLRYTRVSGDYSTRLLRFKSAKRGMVIARSVHEGIASYSQEMWKTACKSSFKQE